MVSYQPADIRWTVAAHAHAAAIAIENSLGEKWYNEAKEGLKFLLSNYFSTHNKCDAALGKTIRPIGGTANGAILLKVRWGLPGHGRSGGLRLIFAAWCTERNVEVQEINKRRDL